MQKTPTEQEIRAAVSNAQVAIATARKRRSEWRRRSQPGGRRQTGVQAQINELRAASKPIRRYIGMYQFHDLPYAEESLLALSAKLQYERAQLRKMLR